MSPCSVDTFSANTDSPGRNRNYGGPADILQAWKRTGPPSKMPPTAGLPADVACQGWAPVKLYRLRQVFGFGRGTRWIVLSQSGGSHAHRFGIRFGAALGGHVLRCMATQ